MIYEEGNGYIKLVAEEGFCITNGEVYGKTVYVSEIDDIDNWYETEEVSDFET